MIKFTWKIILLLSVLFLSLLLIFGMPPSFFQKGVIIKSVEVNSTAYNQGLRAGHIITSIDSKKVSSLEDFSKILQEKNFNSGEVKTIIQTKDSEFVLFSNSLPEITVSDIPKTRLKLGLDLAGGSRALVKAENQDLTSSEISDLIQITNNRLNVYGIADVKITPVSDLGGNNFMLVEVAGATQTDLKDLISQQGKFEAKIGDKIAFIGGDKDITSVCRNDATCAGIESCSQASSEEYFCNFRFVIYLSQTAAERQASITQEIPINKTPQGNYLSEKLDLYLDDILVDSLLISEGLKGRATTQIQIQGSGSGTTESEAFENSKQEMNHLQTILITGSLPYKLEIVKLDTISSELGSDFVKYIFLAGVVALFFVALVVFFRYKKIKSSLALLLTSVSEIIIILGIASFINWNLDLPSIAGILATIGTGIDSQIIVIDESKQNTSLSVKQRLKRAFGIILGAYLTAVVALIPLMWAGAGLLKGFAITTLIGITVGVLITRPAFTDIIGQIEE